MEVSDNLHALNPSMSVEGAGTGTSHPIECKPSGLGPVGGTPLSLGSLGNEGAESSSPNRDRSFRGGSYHR